MRNFLQFDTVFIIVHSSLHFSGNFLKSKYGYWHLLTTNIKFKYLIWLVHISKLSKRDETITNSKIFFKSAHSCLWGLRAFPALDNLGLDIFNNFGRFETPRLEWHLVSIFVFLQTVMVKIILQKIYNQRFSIKWFDIPNLHLSSIMLPSKDIKIILHVSHSEPSITMHALNKLLVHLAIDLKLYWLCTAWAFFSYVSYSYGSIYLSGKLLSISFKLRLFETLRSIQGNFL